MVEEIYNTSTVGEYLSVLRDIHFLIIYMASHKQFEEVFVGEHHNKRTA